MAAEDDVSSFAFAEKMKRNLDTFSAVNCRRSALTLAPSWTRFPG